MKTEALVHDLQSIGSEKGISCIILFGSYARGEEDDRSDVDICIVLDRQDQDLQEAIIEKILDLEKKNDKNIQTIFTTPSFTHIDRILLETIASEGVVLSGELPPVSIQALELKPYMIIKYDLRNLPAAKKMIVKRMLYGQTTTKHMNNKTYQSVKQGLVEKLGAERIGIASIMVKKQLAREIINVLEQQGASTRTYLIWMSEP